MATVQKQSTSKQCNRTRMITSATDYTNKPLLCVYMVF